MSVRLLTILSVLVLGVIPGVAQLSLITFVHNSPEPQLRVVDLYVTQAGATTKIEDINFQSADNLNSVAIFGDLEVTFAAAPGSSIDAGEAFVEHTFTPGADKGYMAILNGVKTPASYVANPNGKDIALSILTFEVEVSVADPTKTGIYFVNGATDLESGDVWLRGSTKAAVAGVAYLGRSLTPTIAERKQTTIDFTKAGDKTKVIASFGVDFSSLASSVVVCVISGFKTPEENDGSTDTLALISVLEDGRVVKSPLIAGSQTSRIQLVHNASDPTLATVDIWVNGTKTFDNATYRKATPFSNLPANTPIVIGFAPASSTNYRDTISTVTLDPLRPGRIYTLIATGVADTSKFMHNPDGRPFGLTVAVLENALEQSSEAGKTSVRVGHYSTDTPKITFASTTTSFGSNLGYGDAAPEYTNVTPAIDTIWVRDTADKKVKGYVCDLRGMNKAFLLLSSGFNQPDSNQNGPAFKLFLIDANGSVNANLAEVSPGTVSVNDDQDDATESWSVGPNPTRDVLNISIPAATGTVNEGCTAQLVNSAGSIVYTGTMSANGISLATSLSVSSLPNGAYQLQVVSASGVVLGSKGLVVTR
ncbi:MAG TPA: DUF4397 domain-containing protein [Candidatus Didemnitutus sp.]|nr:DUF4397 domain-containing protein [Candidatus Didemnitutus sp.]